MYVKLLPYHTLNNTGIHPQQATMMVSVTHMTARSIHNTYDHPHLEYSGNTYHECYKQKHAHVMYVHIRIPSISHSLVLDAFWQ
jgi:hypothetical protein